MTEHDGATDFDFLLGPWRIHNRRKKVYLQPDDPLGTNEEVWEEFPATGGLAEKKLDGRVMIDHFDATFPSGQHVQGMAIRAFDTQTRQWSIVWLDTRQPSDFLPLVGSFKDGIGQFYQVLTLANGIPVHVRYTWDNITNTTARWQQACSIDDGTTWDTNWIMEFSR